MTDAKAPVIFKERDEWKIYVNFTNYLAKSINHTELSAQLTSSLFVNLSICDICDIDVSENGNVYKIS